MSILSGMLAATVAFSGGMGLSLYSENAEVNEPNLFENPEVHYETMFDLMRTGDFESMENFMEDNNTGFYHMRSFRANDRDKVIDQSNRFPGKNMQYEDLDGLMNDASPVNAEGTVEEEMANWKDEVVPVHTKEVGDEETDSWMAEEGFDSMGRYMEEHANNEKMNQYMNEMHSNFDAQDRGSWGQGMNRDSSDDRGFNGMGSMRN